MSDDRYVFWSRSEKRMLDFRYPEAENIHIEEIAYNLSNICRFNGATNQFYSVAQHSVIISKLVDKKHALWGLLHDASEAYLGDMPKYLKHLLGDTYTALEDVWMDVIIEKFRLQSTQPEAVSYWDRMMAKYELYHFMEYPYMPEIDDGHFAIIMSMIGTQLNIEADRKFMERYWEIVQDETQKTIQDRGSYFQGGTGI